MFTNSLFVYFGNTVRIKIVQTMHRSYKLESESESESLES